MFDKYISIKYLPDISKWNIEEEININCLFYCCSSLLSLPNISKWNTSNCKDMSKIFF